MTLPDFALHLRTFSNDIKLYSFVEGCISFFEQSPFIISSLQIGFLLTLSCFCIILL